MHGKPLPVVSLKRACENCTKCCEGWLSADIHGIPMYPGKPCHLVDLDKGCKDYENRPENPCKWFNCQWVLTPSMPEHFKPDISGVIIAEQEVNGTKFIKVTNAPEEPTLEIMSWLVINCKAAGLNLAWDCGKVTYWLGTTEFSEKMTAAFSATSPNK